MSWVLVVSIYTGVAEGWSKTYPYPNQNACRAAGREVKAQMVENTAIRLVWSCIPRVGT